MVEHYLDTVGVRGSNPLPRTILFRERAADFGMKVREQTHWVAHAFGALLFGVSPKHSSREATCRLHLRITGKLANARGVCQHARRVRYPETPRAVNNVSVITKIRSAACPAPIHSLAIVNFSPVRKPRIDENLTLLTDFGQAEAFCTEIFDDPVHEQGVLLKVMTRGPFEQGQQVWILDEDGSKVGATVERIFKHSIDSELTLSTVLPA